jgi:TRAP-type C4-dicarboxylate transport system substrate-binding protein
LTRKFSAKGLGVIAAASLAFTGCAGTAGEDEGSGEGFEYGASQEEIDQTLSELEPVQLTYQPAATSPNSVLAPNAVAFKEYVEERSGGKIEIDLVYGRAIAGYDEVDAALADGRLDLSFHVPVYYPSEYPTYDALSTALHSLPMEPAVGEAISYAVLEELSWSTSGVLEDYEAMGITPISPMMNGGGLYSMCTEPGSTSSDWQGRQVRVANTAHLDVVGDIGAVPVSMEYEEMYEGLQRGTIDCTWGQLTSSAEGGVLEVAPHLTYSSGDHSLSSRASIALLAGSSFKELPLAYQQILFDAAAVNFSSFVSATANGNALAVEQAKGAGGTVAPMDSETEELMSEIQAEQVEALIEEGRLEEDVVDQIYASAEKWTAVAEEMDLEESGDFEEMDEWWSDGAVDFQPFADRVFEEVVLPHRPE